MNNNVNFDPMTGQPIHKNNQQPVVNEQPQVNNQALNQNSMQPNINQETQIQSQLQSIPTVEQNKEQFIGNVQSTNIEKKEEKKEGVNFIFIIILFVIILVAIYFLFPLLAKYV